ncbi:MULTISPECIES: response regulator [Saccharibacter]|uniref:Chemotaxis protein CheY n=1 Tax=Saccharibacter floricola DSM 15669 TaxID=1123227 RepID=A0ABQ0NXG3_9PROT|nr:MULTISPECIES: response regulator [Saccharibacter]MXV36039.1 response regulator [Saccharibacter sp. EH611]MXV56898.1 response regulator [Saccharibacter sp. EH70]MXV66742.1 response regulator [Saccharibacter sp. EH60]GBQ05805.1 chemotaxis protein CheY [Saccharibacter floricola DSM 15669]
MSEKKTVRVLTVDDSKTMLGVLRKALVDAGYDVLQGGDGIEGLEVLETADPSPDVIISDINMPRMDGFQFIEAVRATERFRHLPIICLTTETDQEKKTKARSLGATGWITKPFNAEKLVWAIRRVTA